MSQLDDNLDHGKASYQNAQEIIRFVDSKTGVMTGVVTVTTGIPLAIFHFLLSGKSDEAATILSWVEQGGISKWLVGISAFFLLLGFICGLFSIVAATNGLMARRPLNNLRQQDDSLVKELGRLVLKIVTLGKAGKEGEKPAEVTCLFPFFNEEQRNEALKKFQKLGEAKYTLEEILHEYGHQLGNVGSILAIKINRNRKAVHWFEGQIGMYGVVIILSAALVFFYPPGKPKEEPWDPTKPGHASLTISSGAFG